MISRLISKKIEGEIVERYYGKFTISSKPITLYVVRNCRGERYRLGVKGHRQNGPQVKDLITAIINPFSSFAITSLDSNIEESIDRKHFESWKQVYSFNNNKR